MSKLGNKLSIIIPMYNTEQYIEKCLKSVVNQSYQNLEIIVVDDCSKDNGYKIVQDYMKIDNRIKYVKHEVNKGLFQARITGSKEATGQYIAFLDSDDYVTIDYYRTLVYSAVQNNSDITMGNTVLEYDDGRQILYNLFECNFYTLTNEDCLKNYFKQEGLCFAWHTIWNKIYTMKIWKQAMKHYEKMNEHLIMTEDFAFSTVLFYYAQKFTKVPNDAIFYCKHDKTSTDVKNININKFRKNLSDLKLSFDFVENFMKEVNIYEKYKENFIRWKSLYRSQQISYLKWANLSEKDEKEVKKLINQFCDINVEDLKDENFFSSIETNWNNKLEEIKTAIADKSIKYISFDIFDTLIMRPFFTPSDLFELLDSYFREIYVCDTGINFSKIRKDCEQIARNNLWTKQNQEISIDDIYDTIKDKYKIDESILDKMKNKEIEYEIRFCTKRNTGYELYQMALQMNKKVILVSDMYLEKTTIKRILNNNGYNEIEKLFLSSELKITKSTGDMFKYVCKDLNITPNELLHIGDNYQSDVEMPEKLGITAKHLKKAMDVFIDNRLADVFIKDLPDWQDNRAAMNFFGIRTMIAVVANKYFDNPYRTFNKDSIFNADPYLIGYYGLGMHLYGIANWLIKNIEKKQYESVVFMARDGYLPMKAYEILRKVYPDVPESKYLYVSRKSLIPASIIDKIDLYKLSEVINIYNSTPRKILKYIDNCIDTNKNVEKILSNYNIKLDEKFADMTEFNNFMFIISKELFNVEKNNVSLNKIKLYFKDFFIGKSCVFDVGYSARPEMYISKLLNIHLDTYFININHDEAYEHAKVGEFELNTFFDYKPTFTGNVRELILSNIAPSCIQYDISGEKAVPVFEISHNDYKEITIVNEIQRAALHFIQDIISIFGDDIVKLSYQNYYISLPHEQYLQSPTHLDKQVLGCIYFEDDLRTNKYVNVVDFCNNEMRNHNQHTIDSLFNFSSNVEMTHDQIIQEAEYLILQNKNKMVKLVYYLFFDRNTLKRRFREIFGKNKLIIHSVEKIYRGLKKIKNK